MALLTKKDASLILDPLADNNPITLSGIGNLFCFGNYGSAQSLSGDGYFSAFCFRRW